MAASNSANTVSPGAFERLRAEFPLKLALLVILNPLVYGPYIWLQHHAYFQTTIVPFSAVDRLIPFSSGMVWLYLSIDLLMPIGPFLMNRRADLLRYSSGVLLISLVADIVFIFWPTACPRPAGAETTGLYGLLVAVDGPSHALPSLHAAFAVYSAACGARVFYELGLHPAWRLALWVWVMLILYATLATKQHMLVDIIAGSALGLGGVWSAWRPRLTFSKARPHSTVLSVPYSKPDYQNHKL